jgi:hypothetical protein
VNAFLVRVFRRRQQHVRHEHESEPVLSPLGG